MPLCCGSISKKNSKEKKLLSTLGEEIGLLFQLADDFLDIKGSKKLVGKPIKKDNKKEINFNQFDGLQKSNYLCK